MKSHASFRPPQLWFQPLCLLPGFGKHFEAFIYLASVCYLGLDYSILISNAKFWGLLAFYCISRFKAYKPWKQQLKCYMRGAREGGGGSEKCQKNGTFLSEWPITRCFLFVVMKGRHFGDATNVVALSQRQSRRINGVIRKLENIRRQRQKLENRE